MASTPDGGGYWLVASDGGIFAYGDAGFHGSAGNLTLNKPIVGMTPSHDGGGYWLVASDGGIFAYGDAGFYGSAGNLVLNKPVVGMTASPDSGGYWLVASDGGIFAYGDAGFHGSAGSLTLNKPIVGMTPSHDGGGYWLVASDGGIFAYGDSTFYGSMGGHPLNQPIVGMAATPDGHGYWFVASDGGIFSFGDAAYEGAHPTSGTVNSPKASLVYVKTQNTASGMVEVQSLSASSNFQSVTSPVVSALSCSDVTANGYVEVAPFDGDNMPDLYYIETNKKVNSKVVVRVLSAASGYQTTLLNVTTTIGAAAVSTHGQIEIADVDGDGSPDLVYLQTVDSTSGYVTLQAYSASSGFLAKDGKKATLPISVADVAANGSIAMADVDGDGKADVVYEKVGGTASGNVELHVYSQSSGYQSDILDATTTINGASAANDGSLLLGDVSNTGQVDVMFAMTANAPTSNVELFDSPQINGYGPLVDLGSDPLVGSDVAANGVLSLFIAS